MVWQGVRERPPPWPLQTKMDTELLTEAAQWPSSDWADVVTWHKPTELLVERRRNVPESSNVSYQLVRIRFAPPRVPEVAVDEWAEDKANPKQPWYVYGVHGKAWISSDGAGLSASAGPELAVKWQFNAKDSSGSLEYCEDRLFLTSEQLLRK
jgi:hypothetical protein